MIINIHGFGGDKENSVYRWLKSARPSEIIYGKTYDYLTSQPETILDHYRLVLFDAINRGEKVGVIGTSWGGFFAYCLNADFPEVPTILINPSLNPHLSSRVTEFDRRILMNYFPIFGKHILRHSDQSIRVILGIADEVIHHEYLTTSIFIKDSVETFNGISHHFDVSEFPEIQKVILKHLDQVFDFVD